MIQNFAKSLTLIKKNCIIYIPIEILAENPTLVGNCMIGEPYLGGKL